MADESKTYQLRCMNLCCKSMVVHGEDFEQDPEYQEGDVDFWCEMTQKGQGPDGDGVSMDECCNQSRDCFKEY